MKNNLIILFLLCSLSAFAQPSVVDTTRFDARNGNAYFVATAQALKAYMFPSQTGNNGKFLTTDGSAMSWATVSGGSGDITNGGNTTGAAITIGTNDAFGLNLETNGVTRMAITGAASTGGIVTQTAVTATTNAVVDANIFQINSTGTAATGFGPGLLFQGESSTTDNQDMARIASYWTTATHASREAAVGIQLGNSGLGLINTVLIDRADTDGEGRVRIGTITPVIIDNNSLVFDNNYSIQSTDTETLTLQTTTGAITATATTGAVNITGSAVSETSTSSTRLSIIANSSGIPAAGFGPRIMLQGESSTTGGQDMVGLRAAWVDATHASREARFTVQLGDNGGALTDIFEVNRSSDSDGAIAIGSGNSLVIDNDEMTIGQAYVIGNSSNSLSIGGGSGSLLIGNTAHSGQIRILTSGDFSFQKEGSVTNVSHGPYIMAGTSGTPAAGFGARLGLFAETNGSASGRDLGYLEGVWTNATDASRTSDLVFHTTNSATTNEAFRLYGNQRAMVGGGTNEASAALQVTSTSGGFLPPKMTDAQMVAITSPTEGLVVENTTVDGLCWYNGSAWERLSTNVSPSITAGTGAGTGATASISGTDLAGVITITGGTSASLGATVATITFNTAFKTAPRAVIIAEANENAFAVRNTGVSGRAWYVSSADIAAGSFIIKSGSVSNGAANGTEYKFFYHVIN